MKTTPEWKNELSKMKDAITLHQINVKEEQRINAVIHNIEERIYIKTKKIAKRIENVLNDKFEKERTKRNALSHSVYVAGTPNTVGLGKIIIDETYLQEYLKQNKKMLYIAMNMHYKTFLEIPLEVFLFINLGDYEQYYSEELQEKLYARAQAIYADKIDAQTDIYEKQLMKSQIYSSKDKIYNFYEDVFHMEYGYFNSGDYESQLGMDKFLHYSIKIANTRVLRKLLGEKIHAYEEKKKIEEVSKNSSEKLVKISQDTSNKDLARQEQLYEPYIMRCKLDIFGSHVYISKSETGEIRVFGNECINYIRECLGKYSIPVIKIPAEGYRSVGISFKIPKSDQMTPRECIRYLQQLFEVDDYHVSQIEIEVAPGK